MPMSEDHFQSATHALGATAVRAAEALLRSLGSGVIVLRLPLPMEQANSDLGLAVPLSEDVTLSPAMLRLIAPGEYEGALAARAVEDEAAKRNFESADEFLVAALGVVHGDTLLRIASAAAHACGAKVYLYRLELRG